MPNLFGKDFESAPDYSKIFQDAKKTTLGNRELLTFSRLSSFRNCQRIDYYRNNLKIVPIGADAVALQFGTLMHDAWEKYYSGNLLQKIIFELGCDLQDGNVNPDPQFMTDSNRKMYNLGVAMMTQYAKTYPLDESPFHIVKLEYEFLGEIYNPFTKKYHVTNRDFAIGGKVDGIVMMKDTGLYYILEHKTATNIDRGYLDKLWSDSQIALYAVWIEQVLNISIAGIIYDIATKPMLKMSMGETQSDFLNRQLISDNPKRLKMKKSETDEEFRERLTIKLCEQGSFHREFIPIEKFQKDLLTIELWHWITMLKNAKKNNVYLRNTSQCYGLFGNMPCRYLTVCRSGDAPHIIESFYKTKDSHSELGFVNDLELNNNNESDVLEAF